MSKRMYKSALAFAVVTAMTAACDRGDTVAEPGTATTADGTAHTDDQLATYVQARYQRDPSTAASDIDVTARDGVVTLRGTVPSDAAREHAATLAQQLEGVRSVDNQLQVQPPTNPGSIIAQGRPIESGATAGTSTAEAQDQRSPAWITTKIQSQYFVDTEVKPWNVDVTTRRDGTVILRGEVDDQQSREAAERIARTTEGVTAVDNQLRVRGEATENRAQAADADNEPDAWVTAKVQAKFFMDPDVKGHEINVDTRDGVVTLTGEVERPEERRQAVALARNTEGVRSVTDQLRVVSTDAARTSDADAGDRARAQDPARADAAAPMDDAWITTKVQSKFFLDGDIKGRNINVDTRNGVVTLKGEVESDAERQNAEAIAQETEGVTRVVNQLAVTTRSQ